LRLNPLIGFCGNPGFGLLALAALLELFQQVTQAAGKNAARRPATKQPAEATQQPAAARAALTSAQHIREPSFSFERSVRQDSKKRHRDRRHSSAPPGAAADNAIQQTHCILHLVISTSSSGGKSCTPADPDGDRRQEMKFACGFIA
jgi:hypothetical protein